MKKNYILPMLAIAGTLQLNAQRLQLPAGDLKPVKVSREWRADLTPPSPVRVGNNAHTAVNTKQLNKKTNTWVVGTTQNDQQSNASVYHRVHVFADGKASLTWTASNDASPYVTRGSGYNHFNGTTWGTVNALRIENERTGFPNYVYNPTTNEEIITSHKVNSTTGQAGGVAMNRKTGIGPGTWSSTTVMDTLSTIPGVLWVQTAIAGDYMVCVGSYTDSSASQPNRVWINGIRTPQVYSRYQFSTNTWLVKNQLLPNYDSTRVYAGGGDNYSIAARGNTVAILMGGTFDDVALWKSTDAGATWTKTIVDSFPIGAYRTGLLDTTETNDGAMNVVLDNSGNAHCFWGRRLILDDDTTDNQYSYFPTINGIIYWREGMASGDIQLAAMMNDEDNDGKATFAASWNDESARYGSLAPTTMPNATVGPDGTIYLVYNSLNESDISTDSKNFRDVYLVYSRDNGDTWSMVQSADDSRVGSGAMNLTGWIEYNTEQVFASVADRVNSKLYLTFMHKTSIGRYDATTNPAGAGTHQIYFMSVDTASIFAGTVNAVNETAATDLMVGQNYPNPALGNTVIPVQLRSAADVNISVCDLMGKEVYARDFGKQSAGSHAFELMLNSLPSGIYLYTVEADGVKTSRRMVIE